MAFNIREFFKGLLISEENTNSPKQIEITPGGTSNTKTSILSSQTANRAITLPDDTTTLLGTATVQNVSNKTITTSTVDSTPIGQTVPAAVSTTSLVATTADINGGTIDATVIGATVKAAVSTTSLVADTADINAGTIDATIIGSAVPAAATVTSLVASTAAISGGSINNTTVGAVTPSTGSFTSLSANTATIGGAAVTTASNTQTLTNKSLDDTTTWIVDTVDATKKLAFDVTGNINTTTTIRSSQTLNRTLDLPDVTDTLVARNTTDTLTNKTLTTPIITTPAISGGSINNTTIGATTASTGAFTTLTTTGDVTVGGNAVVTGNLTVNGTTTTLSSQTLDVVDKNITVSKGGTDAAAEGAGLTIDRVSVDGSLIYKDASASKFAAGPLGSEIDLVNVSGSQTLTNKKLDDTTTEIIDTTLPTRKVIFNVEGTAPSTTTLRTAPTVDRVVTFPDATDTLVGLQTTDTLTNKTLASPVINTASISGGTVSGAAVTGGSINNTVIGNTTAAAGTFTTLTATSATVGGGSVTTNTNTQTLSNKSLVDNTTSIIDVTDATKQLKFDVAHPLANVTTTIIAQDAANQTLTLPTGSDNLVSRSSQDTLTNKILSKLRTDVLTVVASGADVTLNPLGAGVYNIGGSVSSVAGITATNGGSFITISNNTGGNVAIKNDSLAAAVGARIYTGTGLDITLTPEASLSLVYDSTDSHWGVIGGTGSGSGGGGINFISGGNAESAQILSLATSATTTSRPNGTQTAGAANLTVGQTTTLPLSQTKSFTISKAAVNAQGQNAYIPFTVDLAYRAKAVKISFDYIVDSGTFQAGSNFGTVQDSDLIWYILDVTNNTFIEPSAIRMLSNSTTISDVFEAEFQTSATGSSYRLIGHVATTSTAAWSIKCENFAVSPNTAVFGSNTAGPFKYTPNIIGVGTPSGVSFTYWRDGSFLVVEGSFNTGTVTATLFQLPLPAGLTIDVDTYSQRGVVGHVVRNIGSPAQPLLAFAGRNYLSIGTGGDANNKWVEVNGNTAFGSGENETVRFKVAITGWQPSSQTSDQTSTRVVALNASTATGTLAAAFNIVKFTTVDRDTHAAYSAATGLYTAAVSGFYDISSTIEISGTGAAGASEGLRIKKGAGAIAANLSLIATSNGTAVYSASGGTFLNVGDTVSVESFSSRTTPTFTITLSAANFAVTRVSGPSQISATETVACKYNTSTTAIDTANTTVIFTNKVYDSHNAYNTTTGLFTAPVSGKYEIIGSIYGSPVSTTAVNTSASVHAKVNGTPFSFMGIFTYQVTAVALTPSPAGATTVELLAGQTLALSAQRDSQISAFSLNGNANLNHISITRIGN